MKKVDWTESYAKHPIFMPSQGCADRLTTGGIPQPQRVIATPRDDTCAVRTERHTPYPILVPAHGLADGLPSAGIP